MNVLWGLLTYRSVGFTSDLPKKLTEGTDLSIALSLKYKCQKEIFFISGKFSFKAFVLLSSSLSKFVFLLTLTNNTCTLLALKKKVIQSTSATEGAQPLLNRKKKELITTACEQLSSTEGAPTVTRSLVSLRSSFDLELTARREILRKPDFLSCLKNLTQKRKEDRTKRDLTFDD